ncbi:MAG TPA: SDR family oxidoreductase [Spirochaetota bacterium]|jgi:2-deoxy-D-gluconate 3-dehydrogenase|nr:SDR family oxidoreductase [Spirochaetota bacterium]HOF14558.1 SDR family oxidoreductase [Spirochaetota bacterium]HOM87716.1 SDR family oxidoreductase [Spirochaetota bacterium]HOR93117.1 SDR family oxidoreductase [Spirochaetota bacterium]HOT19143.1 SDR family oxidoreductase [Spirochaetota bacterium]
MGSLSYNLDGKVAIVTGGTRGIGLAIAQELLKQHAKVVICARKQEGLDRVKEMLKAGDDLLTCVAHIAKEDDVNALVDAAVQKYSTVDILINNVGMNLMTGSLVDVELSAWQKIIDSNLTGTFLVSKKVGAIMRQQKRGKIVSISSVAGRLASPGMNVYGIAKAGVEMMTKNLAVELAPFNVQVNAVAPGMVRTDFSKPFWSNEAIHDMVVKNIPMGRIAEIDEVVHPVLFLASDGARYITGQTIVIDGGASIL